MTTNNCDDTLNWKTVFKRILGGQEQSESSCSLKSIQKTNSVDNIKPQEEELHENVTYVFSSKISFTSSNNIFEDNANKSPFYELTIDEKSTCEFFREREQDKSNSIKLSYNFSENDKCNQVPEWNKVFKSILGKNPSTPMENQKLTSDPIKKQKNLQKCDSFVNTRSAPKKKHCRVPKTKDPEEEKVRELFTMSRMFKPNYHNLNDLDGAGVDIFKWDKNCFSNSCLKSSKVEFTDKASQYESDSESFIPLKGFVAKFKPYTTTDLIAAPQVPFNEPPWDEDLLM